jgi:hypothetical protein
MSTLQVTLPTSLLNSLQEIAKRENVTVDQLAASALSEKVAALMGTEYLEERAKRASRAAYREVLSRVPDVPPIPPDTEVPEEIRRKRAANQRD